MEDPIINEVRRVREELAREVNYDISTLFDNAEEDVERIEKEYGIKWKRVKMEHGRFVTVKK